MGKRIRAESGWQKADGRDKRSEGRGQKTGARFQVSGVRCQRCRWPKNAASLIEKETLKKRIRNIEQGILNVEVRYSIDLY